MKVFTKIEEERILVKCVAAGFFTEQQAQGVREKLAQGKALPDVVVEKLITRDTFVTAASMILGIPPAEVEGRQG